MKMTARQRRRFTCAAAGLLALSLTACGNDGNDNDKDSASGTYKWGINAELSGTVSYYATGMQAGIEAYVDRVNASGGIDGHKIELVALDNAGDASRAATNATQLVTADKVNAMFGFVLSADCSAATPVGERYKVPLACIALAEQNPYAYNLGADNTRAGGAVLEAAKEVTGSDSPTAALVNTNLLTSVGFGDAAENGASAAGVDIVTRQEVDIASSDPSAQVAKIVAAKPDVVLISHSAPGFLSVLKGVRNAGLDIPFVWVDGTSGLPSLAELTDDNVYVLSIYQFVDPAKASGAAADYLTDIKGKIEKDDILNVNAAYSAPSYMTASVFGAALTECGYPCSGEQLKTILDKTTIQLPGLEDAFGYDGDDHYPYPNWYMYKVAGSDLSFIKALAAS